jgi:hypothetical protein
MRNPTLFANSSCVKPAGRALALLELHCLRYYGYIKHATALVQLLVLLQSTVMMILHNRMQAPLQ